MNTANKAQSNKAQVLTHEAIGMLMRQAQVFASAWALVDTEPEKNSALADAEAQKQILRGMLKEILEMHMKLIEDQKVLNKQLIMALAEIVKARITRQDMLPIIDQFIAEHVKVMPSTGPSVH